MLAPLFEIPFLLILGLFTLTLPLNLISKLTFSLLKAFLAPSNFIRALLIQHFMSILAFENILLLLYDAAKGQMTITF